MTLRSFRRGTGVECDPNRRKGKTLSGQDVVFRQTAQEVSREGRPGKGGKLDGHTTAILCVFRNGVTAAPSTLLGKRFHKVYNVTVGSVWNTYTLRSFFI